METLPLDPTGLEKVIKYTFADGELLTLALTHSSYSHENGARNNHRACNECLEFLGDSILSLAVSEEIYGAYPQMPEGDLTKLRSEVVCERALAKYSVKIGLGQYIRLGVGEEKSRGRENKSILADAFEALLAAIYLDSGADGMNNVRSFLLPLVRSELEFVTQRGFNSDSKTRLQQFIQQSEGDFLEYVEISESGPPHMRVFEVEARLNSNVIGRGKGKSKKEAEQNAAEDALELFGVN